MVKFMDLRFHWSPREAVIAASIATIGMSGIFFVHPGLHPLAYLPGWLILAGLVYQTGCELSERSRIRKTDRVDKSG